MLVCVGVDMWLPGGGCGGKGAGLAFLLTGGLSFVDTTDSELHAKLAAKMSLYLWVLILKIYCNSFKYKIVFFEYRMSLTKCCRKACGTVVFQACYRLMLLSWSSGLESNSKVEQYILS